ncbi:MAG: hypothetical protein IKF14_17325 [Atopobiaceae bacterium]|nr:hypothetical protein [Atopobiaceae bacterium]
MGAGPIPILRFTFHDDIDPDTGEVTLSGDEKIQLVIESPEHEYRATGVSVEVPPDYDNPEEGLWDGVSGYEGATDLGIEFFRGRGNSTWIPDKNPSSSSSTRRPTSLAWAQTSTERSWLTSTTSP